MTRMTIMVINGVRSMQSTRRMVKSKGTTKTGFVNPRGQKVVRRTEEQGNAPSQRAYEVVCQHCGHRYGVNGADIHDRKCPKCQDGEPGLPVAHSSFSSPAPWTVADAKARFSEVLEMARREGPQTITRNGKRTAVVVGIEEWEKKTKPKGSLVDFLLNSPLRNSGIEIERDREAPRDIDL